MLTRKRRFRDAVGQVAGALFAEFADKFLIAADEIGGDAGGVFGGEDIDAR